MDGTFIYIYVYVNAHVFESAAATCVHTCYLWAYVREHSYDAQTRISPKTQTPEVIASANTHTQTHTLKKKIS
jgi:hypothetical protein